tara:strand:+ start:111 stop:524 length:414 start_codon:yes stop_codon:yes gene_type:complete
LREEREVAEARALGLERRRNIASHRLERANKPEAAYTASAPRCDSNSRLNSRGKSRGTANALAHQVYTSAEGREARKRYGDLKQTVAHLEAESRKAKSRAQALRQIEINMGKEEAAATHHVPCAPALGAVVAATLAA